MIYSFEQDLKRFAFVLGSLLCTAILLFLFVLYIAFAGDVTVLKHQAIERGYALYCPTDGKFAWVGECEEEE